MKQAALGQDTHLHGLVAVGEVVDDGEGLLKAGAARQHHIRYELADGDYDLEGKGKESAFCDIPAARGTSAGAYSHGGGGGSL